MLEKGVPRIENNMKVWSRALTRNKVMPFEGVFAILHKNIPYKVHFLSTKNTQFLWTFIFGKSCHVATTSVNKFTTATEVGSSAFEVYEAYGVNSINLT